MSLWNAIECDTDITCLMETYGRFHDACIKELSYVSGAEVSHDMAMCFGGRDDRRLSIIFQRQWEPVTLELCFSGMRKMNIVGWQANYFCNIFDCYLALHSDLVTGLDDLLIVWSDNASFNPKFIDDGNILAEPMTSYVIADKLKWRIIQER